MRILKKVLLYTTIIAVSVLAILVVFGFIFQDRIVKQVITELNKSLNSEIKVEQIEFSFLTHFPQASVNLNTVTGFESKDYSASPDSLFHFQNLSLSFNVLDIFNGDIVLQSITVNHGFVNLEVDENGNENFLIVKSDTADTANFFLSLDNVTLEDCTVAFRDYRSNDQYQFYYPHVLATGTFSSTNITAAVFGETEVNKLILDNTPYLTDELAKVDVGIEIDLEHQTFQISRGFVTLRDKYDFEVKGRTVDGKYAYTFKATSLDLRQAETLIPKKHVKFIETYEINGMANVLIELSKKDNANHPTIKGTFDLWDGDFINKKSRESVKISKAIGKFDMGKSASPLTTQIWVERFELITLEGVAKGNVSISNLKHPWFKAKTTGNADLQEIAKIANFGEDFSMYGNVDFDIQLTGSIQNIDSITTHDIKTFKGKAKINISEGKFEIKNVPEINSVTANILLTQNIVIIENYTGNVAQSNSSGSIQAKNWLNFAINTSNTIDITANLNFDIIETNRWTSNSEQQESAFSFPSNVKFKGHINAKEFVHQQTYLTKLSTNVLYQPYKLSLTNTRFNAFGGSVQSDFSMTQTAQQYQFKVDLATQNVDVQNLLETYNNFGQTAVTNQQLRGDLSCNFKIGFDSDRQFSIKKPSIVLDGNFMILNGEMIENKLLIQIPAQIESNKIIALFVNLDAFEQRLHHIKFDTISNHLSIKNSVLTIPKMHISSSALQIDVSGKHSFNNEIDYYISFNLKEVLAKKKKVTTDYGYIEDDELGNRMMFLHLYTKNGEVQVDLDKNGAKKYRQSKSSTEVNTAKSILKEEFGFFKNDTSITISEKEATFEYELDLGEFSEDSTTVRTDSNQVVSDSTKFKKRKKKKTKKEKEDEFEEFDFEDDDY